MDSVDLGAGGKRPAERGTNGWTHWNRTKHGVVVMFLMKILALLVIGFAGILLAGGSCVAKARA